MIEVKCAMGMKVKLKDIAEQMEIQIQDSFTLFNRTTCEFVFISSEELRAAEEDSFDHLPEWMQENREIAIDILENDDNYIELPSSFDIHEYRIMEDFCCTVTNERIQDALFRALRGKGAFRRFKDQLIDFGVEDKWYSYRHERFKEIARDWCEDYGIEYIN